MELSVLSKQVDSHEGYQEDGVHQIGQGDEVAVLALVGDGLLPPPYGGVDARKVYRGLLPYPSQVPARSPPEAGAGQDRRDEEA